MRTPLTSQEHTQAVTAIVEQASRPVVKTTRQDTSAGRFYTIDGDEQPYVSVTHALSCIAKPALINWAANQERTFVMDAAADLYGDLTKTPPLSRVTFLASLQTRLGKQKAHKRALDKAGEIGTQVHGLIEWNLRRVLGQQPGPEPRVVDAAQWAFMAYQDWAQSVDLQPIYIEQTVFSRTHHYAGTMDLLARVQGVPTLIDFKTGKGIYGEAHLQNAAYRAAFAEMGHGDVRDGLIVRLPKNESDPGFETAACPPVEELMPTFCAVLQVWRWWHAGELAYQAKRKGEVAR